MKDQTKNRLLSHTALTLTFMAFCFSGQLFFDYLRNHALHRPWSLVALGGVLLLLVPVLKNKPWAPSLIVNYWATSNFFLASLSGPFAGLRFQAVAIMLTTVLFNSKIPHKHLKYSLYYQGLLLGILEFTNFSLLLKSGSFVHPEFSRFNYLSATTYLLWLSISILNAHLTSQKSLEEKESLLSTILQTLPVAVFGKDITKGFQWNIWNKGAEDLFGIKAKDCIGKYDSDFFPKDQSAFFRQKDIETSHSTGVVEIPEEPAKTRIGTSIVKTKKTVIRGKNGEPLILLGITEDITEKKKNEKQLVEKKEQLELITDNFPGPVSQIDREGRYVFTNKIYEDWFGITRDKIVGKKHRDLLDPQTFAKAEPFIKRALKGERVHYEIPFITVKGERKYVYTELIPNIDGSGNPNGFFTIVHDITSLKLAQAQVVQASKLASLGEMSAGIAHEINNPLTIISGAIAQLSKAHQDPEKLSTKLDTIQRAVDRISKIVNGLRTFSRSSESASRKSCRLSDIIQEALTLTENKAKLYHTTISVVANSDVSIYCNQVEIEQVLVNLISNALDAIKTLPQKWVRIELDNEPTSAVLRVIDSGTGISDTVKEKLFDPFFTTKDVGEGTGLGLSITKGILDQHGAQINILNDFPNTCFEIRFPKPEEFKPVQISKLPLGSTSPSTSL